MAAKIIDFRVHHKLKSARVDYREPAPRGRAKRAARRAARKSSVDQQITHIAWLLRELEDVARDCDRLPPAVVAEAHASIERTRKMLQWSPQPHIDHALLERMYSDLGLHP